MSTSGGKGVGVRRPALLVFDVNETLSDMAPLAAGFEDVGAPGLPAQTWFAELLRDGFALTVSGVAAPFSQLAAQHRCGRVVSSSASDRHREQRSWSPRSAASDRNGR